jgi:hypothetical protein
MPSVRRDQAEDSMSTNKLKSYLAEGKRLREATTRGEWKYVPEAKLVYASAPASFVCEKPNKKEDAEFISDSKTRIERYERIIEELSTALEFYANGGVDLTPKQSKAHLYDKDYPMYSPEWLQRSMSDYVSGERARKTIERADEIAGGGK